MEKIDVLIATYNGEKYIKEQLDSVLNQTYSNITVLISDDKSTDKTLEILKEYEKKDSRVKVFVQEENLGYIKNFEFLLNHVESEIYMLCDQDDVWIPNKIQKSYDKLVNENLDLVFTDLEIVDENLNVINKSMFKYLKIDKRIKKYSDYRLVYLDNCATGCTIMSRKKFLDAILPLPKTTKHLIHDHWITLVVSMHGKISFIEEPLIKYRQHSNNQVGTDKLSTKFKTFDLVREHFINVKLERFDAFVKNDRVFSKELKELNIQALDYFNYIKDKKILNLNKIATFHKIYRNESFGRYVLFFVIMNLPIIARIVFNLRYLVLKIMKKR